MSRNTVAAPALLLLLSGSLLALAGCARAIPDLPQLASFVGPATGFAREDVPGLLTLAESFYRRQDEPSVSKASETWQTAAAADLTRVEGLVGMARAGVWQADHLKAPEARLDAATRALQAAQWCGRIAPAEPACDYWLGASLGLRAREKPSTGLSALPKIEEAFRRAAEKDPALEEGGPDRALALLYLRAPAWPTGLGDPERGLEHARKAAGLRPDYPPNQLALGEALAATGDTAASRAAYERALALSRGRGAAAGPEALEWIEEASRALDGGAEGTGRGH
jgi:tetratricopeptide (TPR) repeat protein